jgi:hypothetical protein
MISSLLLALFLIMALKARLDAFLVYNQDDVLQL